MCHLYTKLSTKQIFPGFVKNLHNNNIGDNNEKSFLQKVREFFVKRSSYSFFIFSDHSR